MDDDDLPSTRGAVRDLEYIVEQISRNQVQLHDDIRGVERSLKADLQADLRGLEERLGAAMTREIKASYERYRSDFGAILDKMKADRDHAAAELHKRR